MALLDDLKVALRIKSTAMDGEIQMWADAALADMRRVGIRDELLDEDDLNPMVKAAVTSYVKASFGYDNDARYRLEQAYRRIVCDLLNSSANIADEEGGE